MWNTIRDISLKHVEMCCLHCCSYSLASQQDDVYEDLWIMNLDIAYKTINVNFLKLMQNNSLQAERYVNFTLQDINYLQEVTKMLKKLSDNVKKPEDISDFLAGRYNSYANFLDLLLNQYYFKVRVEMLSHLFCTHDISVSFILIFLISHSTTGCTFHQTNTSHE